jgi:hypothetical protein
MERLKKVGGLAILSRSFFQHVNEEAKLTKQTVLVQARRRRVVKGKISNDRCKPVYLEKRIGIGVCNVSFKPRIVGFVVKPSDNQLKYILALLVGKLTQSQNHRLRTWNT